jgi:hypothetical protein
MKQKGVWKRMPLFLVWDAMALAIWVLTFGRKNIRWRNVDYRIRDGRLVPVASNPAGNSAR